LTGDLEAALPIARDPQEADRRRLALGPERERVLPPVALEPGQSTLVHDRLPELPVDLPHVRSGEGVGVAHRGHAQQIGGQLGALGMEDERAAHAQCPAEQAGLEDNVVSWGRLTGGRGVQRVAGPVILREDERREVDLAGELNQPVERGDTGVEDRGPRFDLRDLRKSARQRLHQLRLLSRRAEEDTGLHTRGD
jgi:hypothetical protein